MSRKGKDGASLRETLEAVKQLRGITPDELIGPELPNFASEVWSWFVQLNSTRQSGFAHSAISFSEMQAFFRFMGIEPEPWEVQLLHAFDRAFIESTNKDE